MRRKSDPKTKAGLVTLLFVSAGLGAYIIHQDWLIPQYFIPLSLFYAVLCVNTYYSVRLFSAIIPEEDRTQTVVDIGLGMLYFISAWYLNAPWVFLAIIFCLFAAATIKYVLYLNKTRYRSLFEKKIAIDFVGTIGTYAAYVLFNKNGNLIYLWIWAITFPVVNIYILYYQPLYAVDSREQGIGIYRFKGFYSKYKRLLAQLVDINQK